MLNNLYSKEEIEEEKQNYLEDYILEYKAQRGYLPKSLTLDPSYIPESCVRDMVITIDDCDIAIIPTRPLEVQHAS